MRFLAFVFLALFVAFIPMQADAAGTPMGRFGCGQPMPCNIGDPAFPQPQQLMSSVNACVEQNMGPSLGGSFFDDMAGLDASGCFTTNPASFPGTDGLGVLPRCCIKPKSANTCAIFCDLASR